MMNKRANYTPPDTFGMPEKWYIADQVNPVRRNSTEPKPFGGVTPDFINSCQKPTQALTEMMDAVALNKFRKEYEDDMDEIDENNKAQLVRLNADAKDTAAAHWGYIESIILEHGEDPDVVHLIGVHYRSALIHGWKHGVDAVLG